MVLAGLFAATRDPSEPALHVTADQPAAPSSAELGGSVVTTAPEETTSTTVSEPTSTTTTTQPAKPSTTTTATTTTRTPVMAASNGQWQLTRVDAGSRRCLELHVGDFTSGRLLCNAPAPAGLWGDYAIVKAPTATLMVGMADRQVTGLSALMYEGVVGQLGADPSDPALYYAVGQIKNLGGADPRNGFDVFLTQDENTLGRARVSLEAGSHPAPPIVTTAPYGVWKGYRKAGYTGFFYGGNEDVGFYDNPSGDGTRCVLWRRFGGSNEGMILDICPRSADAIFPFAEMRSEGPTSSAVRAAIVVDAPRVTRWTCTWDTGGACFYGMDAQTIRDPGGSGRSFLAYFPGAFQRNGDRMTVTAYDGETIVGQITLDVLPAA